MLPGNKDRRMRAETECIVRGKGVSQWSSVSADTCGQRGGFQEWAVENQRWSRVFPGGDRHARRAVIG